MNFIIQTAAQQKEGLVVMAIIGVFFVIGFIWVSIDKTVKESDLRNKLNSKYSKITIDDINTAYEIEDNYLASKLKEKYYRQEDEIRKKELKKDLIGFNLSELKDVDNILLGYQENKLETQLPKCNKCGGDYMRIWDLNDFTLNVRCEGCKKKFQYTQSDFEDFSLKKFKRLIDQNYSRIEWSNRNELIRPNAISIDTTGIKSNSPEYYSWIVNPKLEPQYRKKKSTKIGEEDKRSRRISQEVMDAVWNRDGGKCVECGSNENLEFDHIIPFSKGGANTYRNIQLLCEKCNRSKSDKIG